MERDAVIIGDTAVPVLSDGSAMIRYQGGRTAGGNDGKNRYESFYRYIPYDYVIASKDLMQAGEKPLIPQGTFKDKIVLITASAAGLSDFRPTPFSAVTPGVEIHANIIDSILSKSFLRTIGEWNERIYIFLLSLLAGIIAVLSRPYAGFSVTLLLAGFATAFHWKLFERGLVLPVVSVSVAIAGTYLGVLLLKYVSEEREKRRIKFAFGHYVAPQVLEEILKSPDSLKLGGEKRFMTVLFSDIEGFTPLSERLAPEEISAILNEYLSRMMTCIKRTGGTLDKFIGDAVMAEWNAPFEQEDHAVRACETALSMMEELAVLRKKWENEQKPLLNIRIGINSGWMVAGNMGSEEIFDYTVIGTEVNTSSRLEPLNKDFGTNIIVSESTYREAEKHCPGKFVFRFLAKVALKGREETLNVYELSGWKDAIRKERLEAIGTFNRGIELFISGRFSEAKKMFQNADGQCSGDGPSKTYISLCEYYEISPPPPGWDSVYRQASK